MATTKSRIGAKPNSGGSLRAQIAALITALLCSAAGIALAADGSADPVPPPAETIVAGPVDGGRYYTTPMPLSGPIADLVFSVYATDVLRAGDGALWVRDYMSIVRIAPDGQSFRHVVGLNDYDAYQDAANLGIGTPMERIGSDASSVRMQLDWKPERTFDLDPQGRLVFVDRNAVFRVGSTGLIEHVAGTGTAGSSGDGGPAVEAEVAPTQLRVDASGAIWFADFVDWPVTNPWPGGETRIRRVDPDGTISTVAALPAFDLAGFAVGPDGSVALFRPSAEVPGSWAVVDVVDPSGSVVRTLGLDTDRCAPTGGYDRSRMPFDGQRVDYVGADSETGDLSICSIDLLTGVTQRAEAGLGADTGSASRMSNVEFSDEALWYVRDDPDNRPNSGLVRLKRPDPAPQASITLGLVTVPAGDPTAFTLSGALVGSLVHGQSLSAVVAPGNATVTVAGPDGWAPSGVACDDDDSGGGAGAGDVLFTVAEGEDVRCVIVMTPTSADLQLTKTVDQATVVQGGTLRYTLTATNQGPGAATRTALTDLLPPGVTFASAGPGCEHDGPSPGGEVRCDLGDIPPGESVTRSVEVTATSTGTVANSAGVASDAADPDLSDNSLAGVESSVVPAEVNPCQTGPGNELWAFGDNTYGQLGSLVPGNSSVPVPVNLIRNVREVSSSGIVTLAALQDRTVCSWGYGWGGYLSRPVGAPPAGFSYWSSPTPAPVLTASGEILRAEKVVAGNPSFAIRDDDGDGAGQLYGWGINQPWGLISSTLPSALVQRAVPVPMPGGRQVVDIDVDRVVVALTGDGRVYSWGLDVADERGPVPGDQTNQPPTDITGYLGLSPGERPVRVFAHIIGLSVLTDQGRILCYTVDPEHPRCANEFGEDFVTDGDVISIDGNGRELALVVDDDGDGDGDVWAQSPEPGDGSQPSGAFPGFRRAALAEDATAVSARGVILATGVSGQVWGWGSPGLGSLDSGGFGTGAVLIPVRVGMTAADLVRAGGSSFVRGTPSGATTRYETRLLRLMLGQTGTLDTEADGATASDRLETTLLMPSALPVGDATDIHVTEAPLDPAIAPNLVGYQAWGEMVSLGQGWPLPASPSDPYELRFGLYMTPVQRAAQETFGGFVERIAVLRNGTVVPDCEPATAPHDEDPCVRSRTFDTATGNAVLTVATTRFSTWSFAAPAPVVDAGGPYTVTEGSTATLNGEASNGIEGATSYRWLLDGSEDRLDNSDQMSATFEAEDDGVHAATFSAVAAEQVGSDLAEITVVNAPPVLGALSTSPVAPVAGSPVMLSVGFDDAGRLDTHTLSVDWGDGEVENLAVDGAGGSTQLLEHVYADQGSRDVVVTVTDDDGGSDSATMSLEVQAAERPTVSLGDQSGLERDTTTGSVFVPVYLSEPVAEPVVVQFHTVDGSAVAGTDYTRWGTSANPRTVTIPAGQLQTTINVPVLADSAVESDEGFSVVATVASGGGVTLGDAVGTATIIDADGTSAVSPAVTVSEVTVHEGDDGQRRAQFQIHLSRPSPGLTLAYQTVAGSASWPGDFTRKLPGTVTFAPGQVSKTIDVAVLPNRTSDVERSFGLELSTVGGPPVEELRMTGTARIVDDD